MPSGVAMRPVLILLGGGGGAVLFYFSSSSLALLTMEGNCYIDDTYSSLFTIMVADKQTYIQTAEQITYRSKQKAQKRT